MKKILAIFCAVVLLLMGLFFYKGGHHALYLMPKLSEMVRSETGSYRAEVHINTDEAFLQSDLQWQSHGQGRIWSLSDYGLYWKEDVLILDNGKAYSLDLPQLSGDMLWGLLLRGRITKDGGGRYHFTGEGGWTVEGRVNCPEEPEYAELTLKQSGGQLAFYVVPAETPVEPVPQTVQEALVLAQMERPMSIREPVEALLPALENLTKLEAEAALRVECGLLNLTETVEVAVENGTALVRRSGMEVELPLPNLLEDVSPVTAGLAVLRLGEFQREGELAIFRMELPEEAVGDLCAQLVPQLEQLGVGFDAATAELAIRGESVETLTLTAGGNVPFLFTEIPLSFRGVFSLKP